MGRGKVQLKQIENKISRQVTFSKRRTGLLKKAHEISVLCDVEVALIVFSHKGKLYEYASNSNMDHVLERYDGYSCAEQKLNGTKSNPQVSLSAEYAKLVKKIDVIQRNIRYFMGEDVDSLSLRELQNLEQQINSSLKRIRKKRNQAMNERISQMQKKDKALQEENNILKKKLKGNEELMRQQSYSGQADLVQSSSSFPFASAQPSIPFEPLASSTNFQNTAITDKPEVENLTNNSPRILPWMI